jgi:O-antigen/teichoic acid export membrane protein
MFKKVLSYSFGLYAAALFASAVRILVKSMVAKTLSKEALGAYSYYNTLLILGGAILAFGLKRSIAKEVAARKEERYFAPLVAAVMTMMAAASLALTGAALLLHQQIDWIYVLILIGVGPATLFEIATATLRGQFDQKREVGAIMIAVIIQAVCITLLIFLTHNTRAPVWGLTIAYVMLSLGILIYFKGRYAAHWQPRQLWQEYHSIEFRTLLVFSAPLWMSDILGIVGQQADQLIVQGQLGFSVLAEYAAAYTFIGLMDQPMTILSRVFLVTFAGGYYHELKQYKQVASLNLLLFSLIGLGLIAISVPLTPILFTSEYTLVPTLVMILTVSSVINSMEVINSSLTIARDYPQANRDAKLWSTAIYIPAAFLLVARFGVIGAAWSNVVSWAGYTLIHAIYMRKMLPNHSVNAIRTLLLGCALYLITIYVLWLGKSPWLVLAVIPIYLGVGQLLRLWDLATIPVLARRLLPEQVDRIVFKRWQ